MQNIFNNRGEGHINTAAKVIITVVIGVLVLGGLHLFFAGEDGVMGKLNDEIEGRMGYDAETSGVRENNGFNDLNDLLSRGKTFKNIRTGCSFAYGRYKVFYNSVVNVC